MRLLGVLFLFFLVQVDFGRVLATDRGTNVDGAGTLLVRPKRGWIFNSGTTKRVTKRPIGWNVSTKREQYPQQQQQQRNLYPKQPQQPQQQQYYAPQQQYYAPQQSYHVQTVRNSPNSVTFNFVKPTKSMTRQLVKAAFTVGVVGAASAYAKPVQSSTKSPSQRAEERERRRQQRLRRRSTTTEMAPVDGNATSTTTTTAVPLANSELIPVMVQDANNLLQIVYVHREQIPLGGIPIAAQLPFPMASGPPVQPPPAASPIATEPSTASVSPPNLTPVITEASSTQPNPTVAS